jgi:nitrate reductase alpha subunit
MGSVVTIVCCSGSFGENRGDHLHAGVDWTGKIGDPIYATEDGEVIRADGNDVNGYGNQLEIKHGDGSRSKYAHLNKFNVKIGDKVKRGEQIAEMGVTGRTTGPHLHYEKITADGKKVEPSDKEVQLAVTPSKNIPGQSNVQLAQNDASGTMDGFEIMAASAAVNDGRSGNKAGGTTNNIAVQSPANQNQNQQVAVASPTPYDTELAKLLFSPMSL